VSSVTVNNFKYASGIFNNDNDMLRRLSHVESADGVNMTSGAGGIWQVSQ